MDNIDRRDFLKKSGTGLMAATASSLWFDRLFAGKLPPSSSFFADHFGVTKEDMKMILEAALSKGGHFSELFFEYKIANNVVMAEDIIKRSSENISLGVGIRVLKGDQTGYGFTSDLSFDKMRQAALTAAAISSSGSGKEAIDLNISKPGQQVYDLDRSFHKTGLDTKINLVKETYNAAKSYDNRIVKIQAFLLDEIQYVTIVNSEGLMISDIRPQVRLIAVSNASDKGELTSGFYSGGGRIGQNYFKKVRTPEEIGTKASETAITLLSAVNPEAGDQPVVLGAGDSGVMVHEAVGHPFEADGIRKKTSIFWDKYGKKVANPIVSIYENPTIPHYRGSINIDDEGIKTGRTQLIENGKLVGFIQDRLNSKLLGFKSTGNGRRQSFQDYPIPRMTNTILAPGKSDPEEIIKSVKKGFFARSFAGGQVSDSGKFTFSVNLGYLIEDGKLTKPVKNATLIGTNVQILNEVTMIGSDMGFFLGSCGKEGQTVPVTAGTPTLKISKMTVGGR